MHIISPYFRYTIRYWSWFADMSDLDIFKTSFLARTETDAMDQLISYIGSEGRILGRIDRVHVEKPS